MDRDSRRPERSATSKVVTVRCGAEEALRAAFGEGAGGGGSPLRPVDRKAAVARIIALQPQLSDRSIARTVGVSAKTVAAVRRGTASNGPARMRIGRDGRARPLSADEGRLLAGQIIAVRPDASLREIARLAGISIGTARSVRQRVRAGESPQLAGRGQPAAAPVPPSGKPPGGVSAPTAEPGQLLRTLRRDPSVRYTEAGRTLLRRLEVCALSPESWRQVLREVPPHCAPQIAELLKGAARTWAALAEDLKSSNGAGP